MFIFNADAFEMGDEDDIVACGVEWSEPCEWICEPIESIHPWMLMAAPVALFMATFNTPDTPKLYAIGGGLLVAWFVIAAFGYLICNTNRALYFHNDGTIRMPLGQPGWFKGKVVEGDIREIITIQKQMSEAPQEKDKPKKFDVCIYFRDGGIATVATNLKEQEAHKVTALLSTELEHMREIMGRLPRQGTLQRTQSGYAMID